MYNSSLRIVKLLFLLVIYVFAKRDLSDEGSLKDAEIHLQIIELIKDEYKVNALSHVTQQKFILILFYFILQQYSQYWVEVNHSAAAYDELKMCKSRMQVYDPQIEEASTKSKLKVSKYEVLSMLVSTLKF